MSTAFGRFPFLTTASLPEACHPARPWLWKGYIAPGETTLLTSVWKSGKSTLFSIILSKMKDGGELAGMPIAKANVVIVTEESPDKWLERSRRLGFGDHLFWICRPFKGKPSFQDWLDLLDEILKIHEHHQIDLVVIDPLANFTPARSENDSGEVLKTLLSLQALTSRNIAVLVAHHPHKGAVIPGQAARGSGALSGYVDTIIEMKRLSSRHAKDRRRRLDAYSRNDETPTTTVIELTTDGTDYLQLSTSGELDYDRARIILEDMLDHADMDQYFTHGDFRRNWPQGFAPPARTTLYRWLKQAVKEKRIQRQGDGTRKEPYRYCLPGAPEKWMAQWTAEFFKSPAPTPNVKPAPAPDAIPQIAPDTATGSGSLQPVSNSSTPEAPAQPRNEFPIDDAMINRINRILIKGYDEEKTPDPDPPVLAPTVQRDWTPPGPHATFWKNFLKGRSNMIDDFTKLGEQIDRKLKQEKPASSTPEPTPPTTSTDSHATDRKPT